MSQERWQRFLPDRSQVIILVMAVVVLFAGTKFVDLAMAKAEAMTGFREAEAQVKALQEQNLLLREALEDAQQGASAELKAREYFNLGRRGEKQIVLQPVDEPASEERAEVVVTAGGPPYWADWWEILSQP